LQTLRPRRTAHIERCDPPPAAPRDDVAVLRRAQCRPWPIRPQSGPSKSSRTYNRSPGMLFLLPTLIVCEQRPPQHERPRPSCSDPRPRGIFCIPASTVQAVARIKISERTARHPAHGVSAPIFLIAWRAIPRHRPPEADLPSWDLPLSPVKASTMTNSTGFSQE